MNEKPETARNANDKRCQRRIYKCLGRPCLATFSFYFRDINRDTLVFLRPETRDVATRVSGRK